MDAFQQISTKAETWFGSRGSELKSSLPDHKAEVDANDFRVVVRAQRRAVLSNGGIAEWLKAAVC
jgi:hypothetical protein